MPHFSFVLWRNQLSRREPVAPTQHILMGLYFTIWANGRVVPLDARATELTCLNDWFNLNQKCNMSPSVAFCLSLGRYWFVSSCGARKKRSRPKVPYYTSARRLGIVDDYYDQDDDDAPPCPAAAVSHSKSSEDWRAGAFGVSLLYWTRLLHSLQRLIRSDSWRAAE